MKYCIFDNDNAVMICATNSRKEAFTAILNYLIEETGTEIPDPIMFPVAAIPKPEDSKTILAPVGDWNDCWNVVWQAQEAYKRISGFIPVS